MPLLGDEGIYDCAPVLDRLRIPHPPGPVYAATHARAIADMVLCSILREQSPEHVTLDDWMPRNQDKVAVAHLLRHSSERLNAFMRSRLSTWLSRNLA